MAPVAGRVSHTQKGRVRRGAALPRTPRVPIPTSRPGFRALLQVGAGGGGQAVGHWWTLLASHDGPGGADSVFRSCPALTRRAGRDAVHAPATEPAAGVGTVPRREHLDPVRGRLPGRPNSTTPSWPPPRSTRQLVAPRATNRRSEQEPDRTRSARSALVQRRPQCQGGH